MGRRRKGSPPSYRLHKQSGQAIVSLPLGNGTYRDVLLGPYDTNESRTEYARVLAEWEAGCGLVAPTSPARDLTVAELILAYWRWAEQHYVDDQGGPAQELDNVHLALRPLNRLYGDTPATAFGPLALRAIQADLCKSLARKTVNARIDRIRRVFK